VRIEIEELFEFRVVRRLKMENNHQILDEMKVIGILDGGYQIGTLKYDKY